MIRITERTTIDLKDEKTGKTKQIRFPSALWFFSTFDEYKVYQDSGAIMFPGNIEDKIEKFLGISHD